MSARALASQKAKRATGAGQSSTSTPTPVDIQTTTSSQKTKMTISEAIYMLDNKVTTVENTLEEMKGTGNKQPNFSVELTKTLKVYEDRMVKIEKENSLLKLKLTQLETSIPSIRSSMQNLETKSSTYDSKIVDIEEIQKLVNKISTQLLNKE